MALSVTVHGFTIKTGAQTTGRLATADITTKNGLDNVIYTLPESSGMRYAIAAISVCNRDVEAASGVGLAVCDSVVPKDYDFLEYNTVIVPRGVLERTQLTLTPGQSVVLRWGTSPAELVPDHEILDFAANWTGATTGTGVIDSSVADRVSASLAEGDTASITSSSFALVEGNTYRIAVSFLSTEVTGVASSITVTGNNGSNDVEFISLGLLDRNKIDDYQTYTADFTVDNLTEFNDTINDFTINLADVDVTVDRISLKQIA